MDYTDEKVKKPIEVLQSFFAVTKLSNKFTKKNAEELNVTLQQLAVINTLSIYPDITLKELTEKMFLDLSNSSISLIIEKLVGLGMVERKVSKEDRREIRLKLTDKGIEKSKKSQEKAYSYKAMVAALEKMNPEDIDNLLRIHGEILKNLNDIK